MVQKAYSIEHQKKVESSLALYDSFGFIIL
jgi:hypothetical protein